MDEIKGIAGAFYWGLALLLTLVGFSLSFLYHFSPFLLIFGAVMLLVGVVKVRPLGYEGLILLGFLVFVLALWFGPVFVAFFMEFFRGL